MQSGEGGVGQGNKRTGEQCRVFPAVPVAAASHPPIPALCSPSTSRMYGVRFKITSSHREMRGNIFGRYTCWLLPSVFELWEGRKPSCRRRRPRADVLPPLNLERNSHCCSSLARFLPLLCHLQTSTMHHALGVSEIITQIFSYLPTSSNTENARVCKDWSDTALDLVWAEIGDLDGIWGSLVETKMDVDGKLVRQMNLFWLHLNRDNLYLGIPADPYSGRLEAFLN